MLKSPPPPIFFNIQIYIIFILSWLIARHIQIHQQSHVRSAAVLSSGVRGPSIYSVVGIHHPRNNQQML